MSQDPWEGDIKDPQSLNKYSYVINNPLKYVDPTGMCAWDLCATESVVISYGVGVVTVWYGIYVATKDNDIPTIVDPAPPKTNKESLFTPYGEGFADGASKATTVPASPKTEQKVTTIPSDSKAPQTVSIPSYETKSVKDNLMMSENEKISPDKLFPTENTSISEVKRKERSMKNNGFFKSHPIRYFKYKGNKYIVDGHHRTQAAKNLRINVYAKKVGKNYFKKKWGKTSKDFI